MQPRLFVKGLARVAQVKAHRWDAGAARVWRGGVVREALGPQRGRFVPVGAVGPLPGGLAVALRESARGVQVVTVNGVDAPINLGGNRHGPAGSRQIEVLALAAAIGPAHAVVAQQAGVFIVEVGPAQVFCVARLGAPQAGEELLDALQQAQVFFVFVQCVGAGAVQRLGLEDALAQGVVGVFGGGGFWALAGAGALQAALAVVAVAVQAVGLQAAGAVVLVVDAGAGAAGAAGAGLLEAQEFVVAGLCAVAAGGGGAGAFALAAQEVAVGVVLEGDGVGRRASGGGFGEAGQAPSVVVAGVPGDGGLADGAGLRVGVGRAPEFLLEGKDAPCRVVLVAAQLGGGQLAGAVVVARGGDGCRCARQAPAPAGGLAQGVPGDALHDGLAGPGEAGDLASSVVLVLQAAAVGVGDGGEQAIGGVLVADAAGVAVEEVLGFRQATGQGMANTANSEAKFGSSA